MIKFAAPCVLAAGRALFYEILINDYMMESMQNYLSPEAKVLELLPEGVLCTSGGVDMDPEEGYM